MLAEFEVHVPFLMVVNLQRYTKCLRAKCTLRSPVHFSTGGGKFLLEVRVFRNVATLKWKQLYVNSENGKKDLIYASNQE